MKLTEFMRESNIVLNLRGNTKLEIIEELLGRMNEIGLIRDYDIALHDIMVRESGHSTGLENGIAIPHAKTEAAHKLGMVFGVKKEGVDFKTLDDKPAYLFFLVISPLNTSGPHIQALALITRNLNSVEAREKLKNAVSAAEIIQTFQTFK
jgi:mannitol/fructose-specific phosphotransferase system IIA component (Ntr-type)